MRSSGKESDLDVLKVSRLIIATLLLMSFISFVEKIYSTVQANQNEVAGRARAAQANGRTLVWVPHERDAFVLAFIVNEPDHEGSDFLCFLCTYWMSRREKLWL